ncbi:MAG TPA: hypothetical protein VE030_11320 [Burkholderiales bacterium]|nr:hypothetical protein [Burkholderiales bacterium]
MQLPVGLIDAMRKLRHIRHQQEGVDPKLCRIYKEAVEQYVNAKPQQQLLQEWYGDGPGKPARASGDRAAARV